MRPAPYVLLICCTFACATAAFAQGNLGDVDHAGIIRAWDEESFARGAAIYASSCAACHGNDGNATNLPNARAFGKDPFKKGGDPYSMWRTLTYGAGMMLPQTWLSPAERYDVTHYVREALMKPTNEKAYTPLTEKYLQDLPKGSSMGHHDGNQARDFGPALASQLGEDLPAALTVFLADDVHLTYDIHRMALEETWRGALDLSKTQHMRLRGEGKPTPAGDALPRMTTWYWAPGETLDPLPANRGPVGIEDGRPSAPAAPALMRYRGRYAYGDRVALAYTVQGRDVLEMPGTAQSGDTTVITHTLRIAPGEKPLTVCVGAHEGGGWPVEGVFGIHGDEAYAPGADARDFLVSTGTEAFPDVLGNFVAAGVSGAKTVAVWRLDDSQRMGLHIPASSETVTLRVHRVAADGEGRLADFSTYLRNERRKSELFLPDLSAFERGGAPRWRQTLLTNAQPNTTRAHYRPETYEDEDQRRRATLDHVPYVVDTIPLPTLNPWNAWLRPSAMDFFPDGRLALATYGGDVWIATGLGEDLDYVQWRRFAAGLFEPMGLKVVDGRVHVTSRDGIIKLHDLNEDGEADYYETFFADPSMSVGFHAFNFGLERDADGNWYYVKPGRFTDYEKPGAVLRIAPDGQSHEIIATGFRVPNGLGMGARGELYVTDNQGAWTPANEINRIVPGEFYGVFQTGRKTTDTFRWPVLWLPQEFDNSPGSLVFVDDARFGPLSGNLMHASFGKGWVYADFDHSNDTPPSAASVALPFQFDAGTMRLAVNPADGQLYTVGLTGWDTEATTAEGCLHRIRHTGEIGCMIIDARAEGEDLVLTFSSPLTDAGKPLDYQVQQWNYRWTSHYGSVHWSVKQPRRKGHDTYLVRDATLNQDRTVLTLAVPNLQGADTTRLTLETTAAAGFPVVETIYFTTPK